MNNRYIVPLTNSWTFEIIAQNNEQFCNGFFLRNIRDKLSESSRYSTFGYSTNIFAIFIKYSIIIGRISPSKQLNLYLQNPMQTTLLKAEFPE